MDYKTYESINVKNPKEFTLLMIEALDELNERTEEVGKLGKFNHLQRLLIKLMMHKTIGENKPKITERFPVFPNSYANLIRLLTIPVGEWNLFEKKYLKEQRLASFCFLDFNLDLNDDVYDYLTEEKSFLEYRGTPVKKALIYCREKKEEGKDYQDAYVHFRTFLIFHPLVKNDREIYEQKIYLNNDPHLLKLLHECYETFNQHTYTHLCPNCGWTLRKKGADDFICNHSKCKDFYDIKTIDEFKMEKGDYYKRVKEAVHFSTVLPGIGEFKLAKKLEKKGWKVTMYDNLEYNGDLKAKKGGQTLYIDCKDYQDWRALRDKIIDDVKNDRYPVDIIIAVPDEHTQKNSRYITNTTTNFKKEKIDTKVMTFKEVAAL